MDRFIKSKVISFLTKGSVISHLFHISLSFTNQILVNGKRLFNHIQQSAYTKTIIDNIKLFKNILYVKI